MIQIIVKVFNKNFLDIEIKHTQKYNDETDEKKSSEKIISQIKNLHFKSKTDIIKIACVFV